MAKQNVCSKFQSSDRFWRRPTKTNQSKHLAQFQIRPSHQINRSRTDQRISHNEQSASCISVCIPSAHSTESALLILTTGLSVSGRGQTSMLVVLDLRKVPETVNHDILPKKLRDTFGIYNSALLWLQTYFVCRFQSILVNTVSWEPVELTCGAPRWSLFGVH